MSPRSLPGAVLALLLVVGVGCAGCASPPEGPAPSGSSAGPVTPVPTTAAGLEALLVTEVPSGLPRVPDDELDPPAGEKSIDDVAGYAQDADHQRGVLEHYGYLRGWERFWRAGDALTSVFIDQFRGGAGASSYAGDLAHNDARYYGGVLEDHPAGLPRGCAVLTVDDPDPHLGLAGPAAFAWCQRGAFTVSIAAVSGTPAAAGAELRAVASAQLNRLPGG